jgi:hypothetical protein
MGAPMTMEALRRKARYGHRSYVYWQTDGGDLRFEPYGRRGLKAGILDTRSRRPLFYIDGTGNSHIARSLSFKLHLWRCAGHATE